MKLKQGRSCALLILIPLFLSGCIGGLWTSASIVYDRHNVYKKIDDYGLSLKVSHAISQDKKYKNTECVIDIAVFHGDVLLAGHVPTVQLQAELRQRLTQIKGYRRLFYRLEVSTVESNLLLDSWITAKIRSQILADGSIDPNAFKVVTSGQIVYLMGDVDKKQADKVVNIARTTNDVVRVVKMFKYFTYLDK